MRLTLVPLAALLALAAGAMAMVPLLVRQAAASHAEKQPAPVVHRLTTSLSVVPLAGGAATPVLRLRGQYGFPVATPDGKALLLQKPLLAETQVWRVPLAGGHAARIGRTPVFTQVAWSPNQAMYAVPDAHGVVVDRLDTSRVGTVADHTGLGGVGPVSWNGDFVAFQDLDRPAHGWTRTLEVRRSSGVPVWQVRLTAAEGPLAVTRDGKRVAVVTGRTLRLVSRYGRRTLATDASQALAPAWAERDSALVYLTTDGRLVLRSVGSGATRVLARGRIGGFTLSTDGRKAYVLELNDAVSIPK